MLYNKNMERLEKVIAHRGLASRREAKDLIVRGMVTVNGAVVHIPGYAVNATDAIVAHTDNKETYLVYKPRGIETTKTTAHARDLRDQLKELAHLFPIGRLDKESEGLILMSTDGTLTKALTQKGSHVGKTYRVTVQENITDNALERMRRGIKLADGITLPAQTSRISRRVFEITLYEGRKHQIRRMADACGLTIESLVRIAIGHLTLGTLKPGQYRKLTQADTAKLKR